MDAGSSDDDNSGRQDTDLPAGTPYDPSVTQEVATHTVYAAIDMAAAYAATPMLVAQLEVTRAVAVASIEVERRQPSVLLVAVAGGIGGYQDHERDESPTQNAYIDTVAASLRIEGDRVETFLNSPELLAGSAIDSVVDWVEDVYRPGDRIVLYGFSHGGVVATVVASRLEQIDIPVQLLITVDAAYSLLSDTVYVPREVPEGTAYNLNFFQDSEIFRLNNVLMSRGAANYAASESTIVENVFLGQSSHQGIDEDTLQESIDRTLTILRVTRNWNMPWQREAEE
jgi:hypothetical protein